MIEATNDSQPLWIQNSIDWQFGAIVTQLALNGVIQIDVHRNNFSK